MNRFLISAAFAAIATAPAMAADVGISINVGQPGFYGRLDIGGFAPPPVVNVQPVFVTPVPEDRPPIYLRVPPEHSRHWKRYCRQYHACGERVFFVQDQWYNHEYAPRYRQEHGHGNHGDHGDHRDNGRHDNGRHDNHQDPRWIDQNGGDHRN
ncbi:hypothetical protein [Paludibacterium yongneupense]|uniref:hypothetical protein n=1 Tax=Paludibacterium yongneupense TaxID=400061 RepID=UPI000412975B|nr:hypothetical protein [Paludibacterium yongneupense]